MRKQLITAAVSLMISATAVQSKNLLTINPGVLQFPATGVGSSATFPTTAYIQNNGSAPVALSALNLGGTNPSDFILSTSCPTSPDTLPVGGTCTASAIFAPSAVGLRTARLVITDVGGSAQAIIFVGQGLAPKAAIGFFPAVVSFGNTAIGLPVNLAPQTYVTISNTGTGSVNISSVSIVGADPKDFVLDSEDCTGTLPAGGSCAAQISFTPQAPGDRTARLQVADNGPGGKQSLALAGFGSTATSMLQVAPSVVAFTPTGTNNTEQTEIVIQNTGTGPVIINGVLLFGPNATDFSFLNGCSEIPVVLEPGAACYSTLFFTPSAIGVRTAQLKVIDNASGGPQVIPLQGSGVVTQLSLTIAPGGSVANLGSTALGNTLYEYLYVQNNGLAAVQLSFTVEGLNAAEFPIFYNGCFYPLNPGNSCPVGIAFSPSKAGLLEAGLKATESITGKSQSFLMAGSGTPSGAALTASALTFAAEPVGTTTPLNYMYVTNQGSASVTIDSVTIGGSAMSDFHIFENYCTAGLVLTSFASCAVAMTFDPSSVGPRIADLNVSYTGASNPAVFPLVGTGLPTTRLITFSPSTLNAGTQPVGDATTSTVFVQNTGDSPVKITGVSIAGDDPGDFAIVENLCPSAPATLAAGTSCQVNVQFTPAAVGLRKALLQVADNATGSPQSLELLGSGNNNATPTLNLPSVVNFSTQPLGSSFQYEILVNNFSNLSVSISKVQITGPNQNDFTEVDTCSTALVSYGYCFIYLTFTPSVTGLRLAQLELTDNATGSPQIIPLSGFGIKASKSIALSPIPVVFPQQQGIGYSATANVTVSNTGSADVLLSKFLILGRNAGDFGIQSNNCPLTPAPLLPNQSCQLTILFAPAATGIRIANLQVTDDAQGSMQTVSLAGYGVPALKLLVENPNSVLFGSVPVGSYGFGVTTITNTGTAPVTFTSFTLSGANPADFPISENFCTFNNPAALSPGQSCTIYLNFIPTATGARSAEIIITSDAKNGPQKILLSGTGQ